MRTKQFCFSRNGVNRVCNLALAVFVAHRRRMFVTQLRSHEQRHSFL